MRKVKKVVEKKAINLLTPMEIERKDGQEEMKAFCELNNEFTGLETLNIHIILSKHFRT